MMLLNPYSKKKERKKSTCIVIFLLGWSLAALIRHLIRGLTPLSLGPQWQPGRPYSRHFKLKTERIVPPEGGALSPTQNGDWN